MPSVKSGELSYMALAMKRGETAYSSLLMVAGAVLSDPEPLLARLVRGCIALAFNACVRAVACSHRLAHAVKSGELSSMALAMKRGATAYSSLLMVAGAVLPDHKPLPSRLGRGCIALAVTACVRAVACSHRLAHTVKGGELSYMMPAMEREELAYSSLLMVAKTVPPDLEPLLSRLGRGCIALAVTACVCAVVCRSATALHMPSRAASSAT